MSTSWGNDGSLESKLLRMPFQKMMAVIESLEDLDQYLLVQLRHEKPDGWEQKIEDVSRRRLKRREFMQFRIAFDADLPLEEAFRLGKLAGYDAENNISRIFPVPPKRNPGLELCAAALAEIILLSKTERRRNSIRYFQEGQLRALAELSEGKLHGKFMVFYPDGKLWIRGAYRNNSIVSASMQFYSPEGKLIEPSPPPNNVLPFRARPSGDSSQ